MVVIIGQVSREYTGREAFQEIDQVATIGGSPSGRPNLGTETRSPAPRGDPARASGRPGPVFLSVPEDLLDEAGAPGLRVDGGDRVPLERRTRTSGRDPAARQRATTSDPRRCRRAARPNRPTSSCSRRSSRCRWSRRGAGRTSSQRASAVSGDGRSRFRRDRHPRPSAPTDARDGSRLNQIRVTSTTRAGDGSTGARRPRACATPASPGRPCRPGGYPCFLRAANERLAGGVLDAAVKIGRPPIRSSNRVGRREQRRRRRMGRTRGAPGEHREDAAPRPRDDTIITTEPAISAPGPRAAFASAARHLPRPDVRRHGLRTPGRDHRIAHPEIAPRSPSPATAAPR